MNNATTRDALNYSIVDDLAQSPKAMYTLEALKTYPSQCKGLLSTLGVIDPSNSRLITFNLDKGEPRIPSSITFQVLVMIQNLVIHRCIIDQGVATCFMSTFVWQKLGSLTLQPSSTSLRAYDGHSSQPQGILTNFHIDLADKTMFIYIEFVNIEHYYNLLLGHSYMYAM